MRMAREVLQNASRAGTTFEEVSPGTHSILKASAERTWYPWVPASCVSKVDVPAGLGISVVPSKPLTVVPVPAFSAVAVTPVAGGAGTEVGAVPPGGMKVM